jgi:hypothetical protein
MKKDDANREGIGEMQDWLLARVRLCCSVQTIIMDFRGFVYTFSHRFFTVPQKQLVVWLS